MWKFNLADAAGKILESCKTSFGRLLCVTTNQKEHSLWNSVSWTAGVTEAVFIAPDGDGSIEICDIMITAEKKAASTITLHFDDSPSPGGNEKVVVSFSLADGSFVTSANFAGRIQGWQGAVLYYTIVGTHIGSILITFIKHDKDHSKTYAVMAAESGW